MTLFKIVYIKPNDSNEFEAMILGTSPEQVQHHLTELYGQLPFFRCIARHSVDYVMPEVERSIYLKLHRSNKQ